MATDQPHGEIPTKGFRNHLPQARHDALLRESVRRWSADDAAHTLENGKLQHYPLRCKLKMWEPTSQYFSDRALAVLLRQRPFWRTTMRADAGETEPCFEPDTLARSQLCVIPGSELAKPTA